MAPLNDLERLFHDSVAHTSIDPIDSTPPDQLPPLTEKELADRGYERTEAWVPTEPTKKAASAERQKRKRQRDAEREIKDFSASVPEETTPTLRKIARKLRSGEIDLEALNSVLDPAPPSQTHVPVPVPVALPFAVEVPVYVPVPAPAPVPVPVAISDPTKTAELHSKRSSVAVTPRDRDGQAVRRILAEGGFKAHLMKWLISSGRQ